jgi:sugar phosphate isomerase/epimerase
MRFAYHNHAWEFRPLEGELPIDILLGECDPELVSFEMDVYWVTVAGADARDYIRRNPTRFKMLHFKDSAGPPKHEQVDVGKGTIDFAAVVRLDAELQHALEYVFVEADDPPDPLAFARASFEYLARSGFDVK